MVKMNKDILEVINTVINYKRYLVGYHVRILKNENYDYMSEIERFYYSLPLPVGMNKNNQDFERVLDYCRDTKYLEELNNTNKEDLEKYYWRNF